MIVLILVAVAAGPIVRGSGRLDEAAILGMASERGMMPVGAGPELGTEIFRWDAELGDFEPFYVGAVIALKKMSEGRHQIMVERPQAPPLRLSIRPHELRYWKRKP